MTFWCPRCWRSIPVECAVCPACSFDLDAYERLPFAEKLLLSLHHPVAENRMIAVEMLGRMRYAPAVAEFDKLLRQDPDALFLRAVAAALREIGTAEARSALERATDHPAALVRHAAEAALARDSCI